MAHPMRLFLSIFFFLLPFVLGAPIYLTGDDVDKMRASGMPELKILAHIADSLPTPHFLDSLFMPARDASGDLSPGSLPYPQSLPQAHHPIQGASHKMQHVMSVMFGVKMKAPIVKGTAYEGHEGELRRPTGSKFNFKKRGW